MLFTTPVGRSDKLLPRHRGPYQVLEKNHSIYTIEDLVNGKRTSTHIYNLKTINSLGKLVTEKPVDFVGFDNVVEFNKNRQNDDNVVKAYKS